MKDDLVDLSQQYKLNSGNNENKPTPISISIPTSPAGAVAMQVADITKEIIRCFTDYSKYREHEITERKRIIATLKAIEYQIDAQKEMYLKAMECQYAERSQLYKMGEIAMHKALEDHDVEVLKIVYKFMLELYNSPVQLNLMGNMFGKIDLF